MFKSAMLGCGSRAKGHAAAYQHVKKTTLAAVCDMNEERLNPFAEEYGIPNKYTDLDEMLEKENPDILHIVTQPDLRVQLLTHAHKAKVPAVIVEKPLALDADDFNAIAKLSEETSTKMCVNHQLRFHPRLLDLLGDVQDGKIGDVQFIDASSRLNLAGQGTHVLNLVLWFNGAMAPNLVFGNVCGTSQFEGTHPAPDLAVAQLNFPNRVRALIANGQNAVATSDDEKNHMHKRIAVYGTRGFVHWKMMSWERSTTDVDFESGEKEYREEDVLGQAGLTDAMCDWLEDESKVHPNCLKQSLTETNTVLGLFASALEGKPVDLPYQPTENLLERLRARG